jgi:hypothetical protein
MTAPEVSPFGMRNPELAMPAGRGRVSQIRDFYTLLDGSQSSI